MKEKKKEEEKKNNLQGTPWNMNTDMAMQEWYMGIIENDGSRCYKGSLGQQYLQLCLNLNNCMYRHHQAIKSDQDTQN